MPVGHAVDGVLLGDSQARSANSEADQGLGRPPVPI
jgi:hypothetical protein